MSYPASAVSIELTTGENINMYGVQVIDTSGTDIAAGKSAFQSSMLKQFIASLATDANPKSFSHTDVMTQSDSSTVWWEVDLQDEYRVSSVKIKNRDCKNNAECLCRLSNATISLLDDYGDVIATQSAGDTCGQMVLSYADFYPFSYGTNDDDDDDDDYYNPTWVSTKLTSQSFVTKSSR
jgi:hypothetical protein